ncbi:G-type lectin S-receptor-like serine/threonine-protein kinase At1g11300 [Vitis riparia]|uniref:G-type lectin S-receptor-like serine/threonine-protein kinase At1g11300 n=1 Tax=Vitis riparia TaxID=96939 RepID=UPI00155A787F|nr:G-type lectin S-receptor-like serine/threonine-protein kinase At1g11300 [Vitis riparia]
MGINSGTSVRALFLLVYYFWFEFCCSAVDTITSTHFIKDSETIVSNGSLFKLGFFGSSNSTKRYVGIWYSKTSVSSVVWVTNRDKPLNDTSRIVKISEDGNLQILNGEKEVIQSSNVSNAVLNTTAQLLDSGSLVRKATSVEGSYGRVSNILLMHFRQI